MKLKSLNQPKKEHVINLKMTDQEKSALQKKADKYTDGNVSAWIRYACLQLDPKPCDLDASR